MKINAITQSKDNMTNPLMAVQNGQSSNAATQSALTKHMVLEIKRFYQQEQSYLREIWKTSRGGPSAFSVPESGVIEI